ncbi:phage baseplate protein [Elizabethkingia miricola]|uniref:phage baseplate protein n=1 Tax=Elizabethkingia miricola TaxID=172045 RepID=UPI0038922FE9
MKRFIFNQTGGLKFTTETLTNIQEAYSIVEGVGRMAGNMAIISGCDEFSNSIISDGVVVINGELLNFKGGVKQNTVIIREEKHSIKFQNGEVKDVIVDRFATFGFSNQYYPWADFKKVIPLNSIEARLTKLEKASKPIIDGNAVVLFMRPANEIPTGWEEVVEFRGRMPVGWNPDNGAFDTVGETGGSKTHKLTIDELPQHSFKIFGGDGMNTSTIANSPESTPACKGDSPNDNEDWNYTITSVDGEAKYGKTNTIGKGQDIDIMNPYRIVMYIRFKG